jgi:hypothetical protein
MVAGVLLLGANWSASRVVVDLHPADAGEIYAKTIKAFDAKIRSQRKGTNVVIKNKPFAGAGWGRKHIPGLATIFIIHFPENVVDGRCVYFREKDPERLEYWRSLGGNRLRDLLIAPGDRSLKRRCKESK